MSVEITVALITMAGSAAGAIIGVLTSAKLTDYRLARIEEQLRTHNSLIDRMYKIETRVSLIEEKR